MKKNLLSVFALLAAVLGLTACTRLQVAPMPFAEKLGTMTVVSNPSADIGIKDTLQKALAKRQIPFKMVAPEEGKSYQGYWITYNARCGQDFITYLSQADFVVHQDDHIVGSGHFEVVHAKWNCFPTKWMNVSYKLEPLYDQLFGNVFVPNK